MVAWSTTDKSANVVLSGGNLTATWNTASRGGVRCDTSFAGGLLYFEVYASAGALGNLAVGFANATENLGTNPVGGSVNSVGVIPGNNSVSINNVSLGAFEHSTIQNTIPYTVCIAVNFTTGRWWARPQTVNGLGFWNGSVTADPASGVGGFTLATLAAGPYFPMISNISSTTGIVTARFGAADMWFPVPAGFSTLDTNVQAFMAAAKFSSYAILQPPQAALSAYKLTSYGILQPPQKSVNVFKLVSYAILQPPPVNGRLDYNWPIPNPRWPKPFIRNESVGTNPNLFPGTVTGLPPGQMLDFFVRKQTRFQDNTPRSAIKAAASPKFAYLLLSGF